MKILTLIMLLALLPGCIFDTQGEVNRDETGRVSGWDISGNAEVPEINTEGQ